MQEVEVGSESPVHIDRCPDNHGLWFDRGELEQILEILGGDQDARVMKLLRDMFKEQGQ